jgi:hypothetical protein
MIRALLLFFFPLLAQADIALLFSNDLHGEIEPCGCRGTPRGGIVRKAKFIQSLKADSLLQLDAGDLLFAQSSIVPLLRKQSEVQARALIDGYNTLKHDAWVPGEKDFALGLPFFERMKKTARFAVLGANLERRSGAALLKPSVVLKKKSGVRELRIGVIGLVGADLPWPKELRAKDPVETARKLVPELRKKSDLVIALTHLGLDEDRKLAAAVPGIDLIVGAHSQSFLQKPEKIGSTWILQSSYRGEYIGHATLTERGFDPERHWLVGLEAEFDDPESPLARKIESLKKEIAKLDQDTSPKNVALPSSKQSFQTFPRCAECHTPQTLFWLTTAHAKALEPLQEAKQLLNRECIGCHSVGFGHPKGFQAAGDHARWADGRKIAPEEWTAFMKTLRSVKSLDESLAAFGGPPEPATQILGKIGRAHAPVQCESCHGLGHEHPFQGAVTRKPEIKTCLTCHTAERAPSWYTPGQPGKPNLPLIQAKLKSVSCPQE